MIKGICRGSIISICGFNDRRGMKLAVFVANSVFFCYNYPDYAKNINYPLIKQS